MAFPRWLEESFKISVLFASIILAVVLKLSIKSSKRELNLPPSPAKLPLIGNLYQLGKMPHLSLHSLAEKFGLIFYLQLGEVLTVVISSARMAKEVMKTHDLAVSSRPQLFSAKLLFCNCMDIVFSPYDAYWRHIHKICILELLSAKRVQSFRFVREQEIARLVNQVAASYPGTTNLTKMLGPYDNDVLCRAAFGRDFSEAGEYNRRGFQRCLKSIKSCLGDIVLVISSLP